MKVKYPIKIESRGTERYWFASVPDLPGCFATGIGLEQLTRNARRAIALHIQSHKYVPQKHDPLEIKCDEEDILLVEVDL